MPNLRIASIDALPFARDRSALAGAVASAAPHVAVVHNAPHLARWRSLSAEIARGAGLVVVGGGRTGGANLVLSTLAVDSGAVLDMLFTSTPLRPAGACVARLRYRGAEFAVAGVRLGGAFDALARLDAALADVADVPAVLSVVDAPGALTDRGEVVGGRFVVPPTVAVRSVRTDGPLVVADLDLAAASDG